MMNEIKQATIKFQELIPVFIREVIDLMEDIPEHQTITLSQAFLMQQIKVRGTVNASDIGNILGITSGPVTYITTRLIYSGFIERRPNPQDRRIMEFTLTRQGKEIISSLLQSREKKWEVLFQQLGKEKSLSIISIIEEMIQLLQNNTK